MILNTSAYNPTLQCTRACTQQEIKEERYMKKKFCLRSVEGWSRWGKDGTHSFCYSMDLCLCEICHIAVTFDKCKCYTRGWIRKGKTSVRGKQLVEQETWKKQTRRSIISCCWKYLTPSYIILCHPATKTNFLVSKHTPFCRQYQNVSVTFYIDEVEQ